MQIRTDRLTLVTATRDMLASELAFLKDNGQQNSFAQALNAEVATSWPPLYNDVDTCSYILDQITQHPDKEGWWSWYILLNRSTEPPLLIGIAGFHGPADEEGTAEIGYGVVDEQQRRGFAPEAAKALTDWAFQHDHVKRMRITTLDTPELVPSTKVAEKCGYSFAGTKASDEGTILIYELSRADYLQVESQARPNA